VGHTIKILLFSFGYVKLWRSKLYSIIRKKKIIIIVKESNSSLDFDEFDSFSKNYFKKWR
jgi:hypothetical protein